MGKLASILAILCGLLLAQYRPPFQRSTGGGGAISENFATFTLTQAQVQTLHSAGYLLVAAQGPGTWVEPISAALENVYGAVFTSGSALSVNYNGVGGQTALATVSATFLTGPVANQTTYMPESNPTAGGLLATTYINVPIYLTSISADFGGGAGSSLIVHLTYRLHTGLL